MADFDDVVKTALGFSRDVPPGTSASEPVEFRTVDIAGEGTWQPVRGMVDEGNADDPDLIGVRGRRSSLPIRVLLFKSDAILSITEGRDQIRRNGIKYVIQAILNEDAGSFYVYAKP